VLRKTVWGTYLTLLAASALPALAAAQTETSGMAAPAPAYTLQPVEVIGVTPLPGSGVDIDKIPAKRPDPRRERSAP